MPPGPLRPPPPAIVPRALSHNDIIGYAIGALLPPAAGAALVHLTTDGTPDERVALLAHLALAVTDDADHVIIGTASLHAAQILAAQLATLTDRTEPPLVDLYVRATETRFVLDSQNLLDAETE
jgi:hypothetical protein